jgi:preprotein translocase subunit SecA
MNEQRKVVYGIRNQILEGQDLRDRAMEELAEAVETIIGVHCVSEYSEEWNLDGLANEIKTFWPSEVTAERMGECSSTDELYEVLMAEAVAHYERREGELGEEIMREVERQVMLRIVDQKWREHLEEMDYLREGINLRAMGQKDPLTEWQREGFEMFEAMMKGVATDFPEDWDLEGLVREAKVYYPTRFEPEELLQAARADEVFESLLAEAVSYYEQREETMPGGADTMRQLEREIMLQIIDTRWREHLSEMDYLREGINLRAMGQKDPLVEWTRDGFEMFGQLMSAIDDDFVKYVMHVEVLVEAAPEPDLSQFHYEAAADPVQGSAGINTALAAEAAANPEMAQQAQAPVADEPSMVPVVRAEHEKVGRNQPCWCGSGKKYKLCHGK